MRPALAVVSSFDPSLLEAQAAALRRLARAVPLALAGPGADGRALRPARRPPPRRRPRSGSRRSCADVMRPCPIRADRPLILLTGATGYVGGRLLRLFEERAEHVRCLTRRPEALAPRRSRHDDDRRRRRPRPRVLASGDARGRDRLLPRPFDDLGDAASRSRIVVVPPISRLRRARPACVGSSTWAGSAPAAISRVTSRVARKSAAFSPTRACRRSSSGPRS